MFQQKFWQGVGQATQIEKELANMQGEFLASFHKGQS